MTVGYNITKIRYTDRYGALLWEEPMALSRLYAVGQDLTHEYVRYIVLRVAVDGETEVVNLRRAEEGEEASE
jgi:hypothetical protein